MSQKSSSRIWIIAGTGCLLLAGLLLMLASLGSKPAPLAQATIPTPTVSPTSLPPTKTPTPEPSPTPTEKVIDDPVVASVNGYSINHSVWRKTVLIDQVASGIAGMPDPQPDTVLRRIISEELLLQAFPPEQMPTAEQVEERIALMEQAWGVTDASLAAALEAVKLDRAAFEHAIQRVLVVQAAMEILESQGHNLTAWLREQQDSADVLIFEDKAVLDIADAQATIATQVTSSPLPTPTKVPLSALALGVAEQAPDFTLEQTGGGTFTLAEQLAEGPVVMVFFQKCG
jgi:hypothetical protein